MHVWKCIGKQQFVDCGVCLVVSSHTNSNSTHRGMPVPEAELLYMQEVEKMEGYGQESFHAKVNHCHTQC